MKRLLEKLQRKNKETLRDTLAMSVLPEIIREQGQLKYSYGGCDNILRDNCRLAYKIADSMIWARG